MQILIVTDSKLAIKTKGKFEENLVDTDILGFLFNFFNILWNLILILPGGHKSW